MDWCRNEWHPFFGAFWVAPSKSTYLCINAFQKWPQKLRKIPIMLRPLYRTTTNNTGLFVHFRFFPRWVFFVGKGGGNPWKIKDCFETWKISLQMKEWMALNYGGACTCFSSTKWRPKVAITPRSPCRRKCTFIDCSLPSITYLLRPIPYFNPSCTWLCSISRYLMGQKAEKQQYDD